MSVTMPNSGDCSAQTCANISAYTQLTQMYPARKKFRRSGFSAVSTPFLLYLRSANSRFIFRHTTLIEMEWLRCRLWFAIFCSMIKAEFVCEVVVVVSPPNIVEKCKPVYQPRRLAGPPDTSAQLRSLPVRGQHPDDPLP